jgi:phosphodiesterase/alkaline phosphatase D-like protein
MQKKFSLLALVVALALFTFAQEARAQNVQITQGPVVEKTTSDSAIIAWSTNVNASSAVYYGIDRNNLDQSAQAPWGGLTHRVTIMNLKPNTTYFYRVQSAHAQGTGTEALSEISQFQTTGGQASANPAGSSSGPSTGSADAKVMVGPIPQQVTENSAVLWWETAIPSNTEVKYGAAPNSLTQSAKGQDNERTHKVQLTGLKPATTYHFAVLKPDGTPNETGQFTTLPMNAEQVQKVRLIDGPVLEFLSDNRAVIAWTTDVPSSSRVRYGEDQKQLSQSAEGPWGTKHRVELTNLKPGARFYFSVDSIQSAGQGGGASSAVATFHTLAPGQQALKINP